MKINPGVQEEHIGCTRAFSPGTSWKAPKKSLLLLTLFKMNHRLKAKLKVFTQSVSVCGREGASRQLLFEGGIQSYSGKCGLDD